MISRRTFLTQAAATIPARLQLAGSVESTGSVIRNSAENSSQFFETRGIVLSVKDLSSFNWPPLAKQAGLTTIATHITPREVSSFIGSEDGSRFLESCRKHDLHVEHELHAVSDLLPRELFSKNPSMFRMNESGNRVADYNLCVSSRDALEIVAEKVDRFTRLLPSSTGRYFYWIDDGQPMCYCSRCKGFSESDQALILENHILAYIQRMDNRARLAHLAYANTLSRPQKINPKPGIFLEFAPIERRHDTPINARDQKGSSGALSHGQILDALDENLEHFGSEDAQVLEYWLDVSRFAGWKRDNIHRIPWDKRVFYSDLKTFGDRGIRHITSFAAWMDGNYIKQWGTEPVLEYGNGFRQYAGPTNP